MKTAISIPDPIFRQAEKFAKQHKMTRSALYAKAVQSYVVQHRNEQLVEAINAVCDRVDMSLDKGLEAMQRASLRREDW